MATTYGVISDLHAVDVRIVHPTIQILLDEEVDALVLNGDLFGERSGMKSLDYLANVLNFAGKSELPTFIVMGSHEEVPIAEPVVNHFTGKYGNLHNGFQDPKVEVNGHHLVFLPGSDWSPSSSYKRGYHLQNEHPSQFYELKGGGVVGAFNMNDLRELVTEPEKTVVFSHIPRSFISPENSVDMARFGLALDNYHSWEVEYLNGKKGNLKAYKLFGDELQQFFKERGVHSFEGVIVSNGSIIPYDSAQRILATFPTLPIELKEENRGNKDLTALFNELGITKNITGHFHESAGRANDINGNPVEEGTFVPHLFYNASCLDRGMVGIVTVDDAKVAFENINLRERLK